MQKELVVITGASSGIGEAIAKIFIKEGYPLLLLARRKERLERFESPNVLCRQVDVTKSEALKKAINEAEKKFGPVGCLINNAGVMLCGKVQSQNPEEWKQMFDVNVMGVLNGIHAVLSPMIERKKGTIINISSVAGRKTFPNHAVYCGTKFAVHAISETLREEISPFNVRLITVAPGIVETELVSHITSKEIQSEYQEWKKGIGEVLRPDDIARAVYFAHTQPPHVCVREIVVAPSKQGP